LSHWTDPNAKQFVCLIHEDQLRALCLLFNAGPEAVDFWLPPALPEA
jgi:isoamylase